MLPNDPVHLALEAFWRAYQESPDPRPKPAMYYEAFQFGAGRVMADQLSHLVLDGIKTATSDLLWHLESQGKPLWKVGDEHIVQNGSWAPVCVIRTLELEIRPFNQLDEAFAYDYGEGDRSLAWLSSHLWDWYGAQCRRDLHREPEPEMPLLCERFEVVWRP